MKQKSKKKLRNLLHNNDIFGYPIPLNFNGRRTVHTTSIGGIFSIIIKVMYGIYIFNEAKQMVTYQDDQVN